MPDATQGRFQPSPCRNREVPENQTVVNPGVDEAVVTEAGAGSAEVKWLSVIDDNRALIHSYMSSVTTNRDEHEDLVQSAIAVAWLTWSSGPDTSRIHPWIIHCCRIARREWAYTGRITRGAEEYIDGVVLDEIDASVQDVENKDDDLAWDALMSIAPRQREAVVYRVMLSWSVKNTARAMDCREGTVKAHLHAAMKSLRARGASMRQLGHD